MILVVTDGNQVIIVYVILTFNSHQQVCVTLLTIWLQFETKHLWESCLGLTLLVSYINLVA